MWVHNKNDSEGGHLQAKEKGFKGKQFCQWIDLRLPASGIMFKLPGMWYFVMIALAN